MRINNLKPVIAFAGLMGIFGLMASGGGTRVCTGEWSALTNISGYMYIISSIFLLLEALVDKSSFE